MKVIKIIKEIGRNSQIDWIATLFLSTCIAIALAIGGLYLYNAVMKGEIQGNAPSTIFPKRYNDKVISRIIETFDQKESISKKTRAGYSGAEDPAI